MKRLLFLLVFIHAASAAQMKRQPPPADGDKYGFYLTGNRNRTSIPFEFQSNLIIVPVRLNDSDTLRFIVDTGVGYTILTDPRIVRPQSLRISRKITLAGAGGGDALTASVSIGNTMSLGALRVQHHNVIVLDEDLLKLSEYAGMPIHGIIGYELFANLVVSIDFQTREITFVKPRKYRYRRRTGDRYPISIQQRKVYTDVLSVSNGGPLRPLRVLLDTGAGQALLLDRFNSPAALTLPDKTIRVQLGRGLNGIINGDLGRMPKVRFGRHELTDVLVAFPDSLDFGQKLADMPERQGNVGCELLRRFRITFNYPEKYMVVKPVKRLLREQFEYNMSGLELRARGKRFHQYFIDTVTEGSPGSLAGLRPGDEVLFINNKTTKLMTMGEINQLFQKQVGKEISLLVRRSGQVLLTQLILKRLI